MKITVTSYLAGMVNHGTMDEMAKITYIIIYLARVVDTINDTDKNRFRIEYTIVTFA